MLSFASFNQLHATFGLNSSDFFRYFQLRDFARAHSPSFPQIPPSSSLDHILSAAALPMGYISYLYELVLPTSESMIEKIKANWESDLQIKFSDRFWGEALEAVNSSSSCARLSLIQFKVLHRAHYSKAKLAKIYPDTVEDKCNMYSLSPCDLAHMFWLCPKLVGFWEAFFRTISEILQIRISPSPHIAIFGGPEDINTMSKIKMNITAFTSLIARRRILLQWKSSLPPSFKSWIGDVMSFLKLEKIKLSLRGSSDRFYSHWKPLISYVDKLPAGDFFSVMLGFDPACCLVNYLRSCTCLSPAHYPLPAAHHPHLIYGCVGG